MAYCPLKPSLNYSDTSEVLSHFGIYFDLPSQTPIAQIMANQTLTNIFVIVMHELLSIQHNSICDTVWSLFGICCRATH